MQDSFGRRIDYLRLSVTDRCNLRCGYCMPAEGIPSVGHEAILSYEELTRVAAAAVRLGVRKIRITGGEPLVRKGIAGLVRALARLPGAPEVVLTTNGLLLAEMAAELKQAGLARINVSLDTLCPERFRRITRREGLGRVLAGLEAAQRNGLTPVKLNMVPFRDLNADEIGDFARLTLDHPWEVRFIEYMPIAGEGDYPPSALFPAAAILGELSRMGHLTPLPTAAGAGPARRFRYPGARGTVGLIPAVSGHLCGTCNRLRITADGRVRPCLLSAEEIDLRTELRAGTDEAGLARLLSGAALAKPERHRLGEADFRMGDRPMVGLGG